MIRFLSLIDEGDLDLGKYFQESNAYVKNECVKNPNISYNEIYRSSASETQISNEIQNKCQGNPFVFITYTHGNESACGINDTGTISVSKNNACSFKNSLFYSTSCLNAKQLGYILVQNGCFAFVGYNEESKAFLCSPLKEVCIKCDNACLLMFVQSHDKTIEDAFNEALHVFNMEISKLKQPFQIPLRGALVHNRNALRLLGNKSLTRDDIDK